MQIDEAEQNNRSRPRIDSSYYTGELPPGIEEH